MNNKIIVAIDSDHLNNSIKLVKKIKKEIFAIKIGYEFFFNFGLNGYKEIQKENLNIFLDLKLHDIPNTIKKSIIAISKLKPYFTTVHISFSCTLCMIKITDEDAALHTRVSKTKPNLLGIKYARICLRMVGFF